MEKKITVYIVSANSKETVYATKSQATVAIDTLVKFDVIAELQQVKRIVTLA